MGQAHWEIEGGKGPWPEFLRDLTICTISAVISVGPGRGHHAASTVVPGPALQLVPWSQACLKVSGHVVA